MLSSRASLRFTVATLRYRLAGRFGFLSGLTLRRWRTRQAHCPGRVHEPPMMLLDLTVDQPAMGCERAQRRLFILPHEAAVPENIGAENGGELALQYPPLKTAIILP
jgi:hypothetical protein